MEPRTAADQLFKALATLLLETSGHTKTEKELSSEIKRVDFWFVPDPAKKPNPTLGVLGRMTQNACVLEGYKNAPDTDEMIRCLVKLVLLRERLERRLRRFQRRMAALRDVSDGASPAGRSACRW